MVLWGTFRFQTGSIKRSDDFDSMLDELSFDSKLVRLKGNDITLTSAQVDCFDSKLVRLKDLWGVCESKDVMGFDSKLVRLKAFFNIGHAFAEVSIPNWFD